MPERGAGQKLPKRDNHERLEGCPGCGESRETRAVPADVTLLILSNRNPNHPHSDAKQGNPRSRCTIGSLLKHKSSSYCHLLIQVTTEASVVLKIKRLGVSRRVGNDYTLRDLEECLGESHHKIQRWIANGWLRDRLQGTRRHNGNGRDIHRIQERDILTFIREHPREISLDRVDSVWFLDLLLLKGKEVRETRSQSRTGVDGEAA
jgi:hypothetical protein